MPQALLHCFSTRPYLFLSKMFDPNECLLVLGYSRVPSTGCDGLWSCGCYQQSPVLIYGHEWCVWLVCVWLAATSWGWASLVLTAMVILPLHLHFCGTNVINHFICEILFLLKLACSDTSLNELMIFITSIFTLLLPFGFILLSYIQIATAVLKIHSAQSRLKTLSPCGSHLTVVAIFYGAVISMHMKQQSKSFPDLDKFISVFYGALTPMLNPLAYSLRNKDVKKALRKATVKRKLSLFLLLNF